MLLRVFYMYLFVYICVHTHAYVYNCIQCHSVKSHTLLTSHSSRAAGGLDLRDHRLLLSSLTA